MRNSTEFNSARTSHSGKSDSGMGSEQSSTYDENTSLFDALCPEGFKVDVDGLCSEYVVLFLSPLLSSSLPLSSYFLLTGMTMD